VPLSHTLAVPSALLLDTISVPLSAPVVVGVKVTLIVQLAIAASVVPHVLVWAKSPEAEMTMLDSVPVPVLVNDTVCAGLVVPVAWLAKVSVVGLTVATGCPAPLTVIEAEALFDPPVPLQISVYVETPVIVGDTRLLPLVGCVPLHAPLAVHAVACVLDQVKVELLPEVSVDGFAVKVTVGIGGVVTVTVVDARAVPLVPVQVSV